jgi:hypothetical protein
MQLAMRSAVAVVAAALLVVAVRTAPAVAQTPGKGKVVQTEGVWVAFDPAASTIKVKINKHEGGTAPKELMPKTGEEATFKVKPEGTVLTKTTVKIRGHKAELKDIPAGKTVLVYWGPDTADPKARFARSVDVILSDDELDEMYPDKPGEAPPSEPGGEE